MSCMLHNTWVLGASTKPERYSNKAVKALQQSGYEVQALGMRAGEIDGVAIWTELPSEYRCHTLSLYLNAQRQAPWISKIIAIRPQRVIFNPGTENPELEAALSHAGIAFEHACTLVLLATHQYFQSPQ